MTCNDMIDNNVLVSALAYVKQKIQVQVKGQDTSQRNSMGVYHRIQYSTITLVLACCNVVDVG